MPDDPDGAEFKGPVICGEPADVPEARGKDAAPDADGNPVAVDPKVPFVVAVPPRVPPDVAVPPNVPPDDALPEDAPPVCAIAADETRRPRTADARRVVFIVLSPFERPLIHFQTRAALEVLHDKRATFLCCYGHERCEIPTHGRRPSAPQAGC